MKISPLTFKRSALSPHTFKKLKSLNSPEKIQNFLSTLHFNLEDRGETYMSVERSINAREAHCFEGALVAAAALWINGERPLLMDLKTTNKDIDHVVCLYRREGKWGAIGKTNHAVLRFRDPVYRDTRELALSYFHEYFLPSGVKTLREFSTPFDLSKCKINWLTDTEDLYKLVEEIDFSPHAKLINSKQIKVLRKAEKIEIKAGGIVEWPKRKK